MPAILTHKAIMMLARERVRDIRDRLTFKKASAVPLTDLELRLLRLSSLTFTLMSDGDDNPAEAPSLPTDPAWPAGFGAGVSRYAVMGSMGPDIPGMSAIVAPAQAAWFDMIHKGTPDANREQVNARTSDMALGIYRKASQAMTNRPTDGPAAARAYLRDLNRIRAYTLGHLTHIAGDVLAHPFINDVEWHVPSRESSAFFTALHLQELRKFGHAKVEGSLDSRVARDFFNRAGPRRGQAWSAWWPPVDEVPAEIYQGYAEALNEIYKANVDRPDGLRAYEDAVNKHTLPVPNAAFFRDGYRTLNHGGVGLLYDWGYGSWLGFLSVVFVPLMATMPLTFALARGRKVFETSLEEAGERGTFEAFTLPLSMNCITPLAFGILASGKIWLGAEGELTAGLIGSAVSALFGLLAIPIFFTEADPGAGWRWALAFALPAGYGLGMSIVALTQCIKGEDRRSKIPLIFAAPFLIAGVLAILLLIFAELIGNLGSETAGLVLWSVFAGLIGVTAIILLFLLPAVLRDAKLPEDPLAFPAQRPHHVRLYDRASLFTLPGQHIPANVEVHYPSGVRPLLRLWWTGAGSRFVRPHHAYLEVSASEDGSSPTLVPAPITPVTVRQLAEYLPVAFRLRGHDGLNCALVHPEDANVPLPPGATFADGGDLKEEDEEDAAASSQSRAAATFRKLTDQNDKDSAVLHHPPKRAQAVRFDRRGPVPFDPREPETVLGVGKVSGDGNRLTGDGTAFRSFFVEGDRIVVNGSARVVTRVESDTVLVISSAFRPAAKNDKYERVGHGDEVVHGYSFVARSHDTAHRGDTIMELAGDLGAILCMGGTSHMLDGTEAPVSDFTGLTLEGGGAIPQPTLQKVTRAFRNWSLDRRLVDEWREIVTGDASIPTTAATGEQVLLTHGWVPTLRKWLRVVDDQSVNAASGAAHSAGANEPSNLDLSLAIAHLFDMPAPTVVVAAGGTP
jgi:hypothetical protein